MTRAEPNLRSFGLYVGRQSGAPRRARLVPSAPCEIHSNGFFIVAPSAHWTFETLCWRGRSSVSFRGISRTLLASGARSLQPGVTARCSRARDGVGEDAESCSSINSGLPGAQLGSSVAFAFGSGCG